MPVSLPQMAFGVLLVRAVDVIPRGAEIADAAAALRHHHDPVARFDHGHARTNLDDFARSLVTAEWTSHASQEHMELGAQGSRVNLDLRVVLGDPGIVKIFQAALTLAGDNNAFHRKLPNLDSCAA